LTKGGSSLGGLGIYAALRPFDRPAAAGKLRISATLRQDKCVTHLLPTFKRHGVPESGYGGQASDEFSKKQTRKRQRPVGALTRLSRLDKPPYTD
jgi:hypothetical protein